MKKEYLHLEKTFNYFTIGSYDLYVVWKTKKVRSSFPLKDKNLHLLCKIYHIMFILMFMWRRLLWRDQKNTFLYVMMNITSPPKKSKPAAHLEQNSDHYFT